jgi:hypothetical protein
MILEFPQQIFDDSSNTKYRENVSGGSRVVPYGQADRQTDEQTGMTKKRVCFCNFTKAPKNSGSQ